MPLIYVFWTIALLTIIAAATQSSGALSYRTTRNTAEFAQQEAMAEAALTLAVLSLLDERHGKRPRIDGTPHTFRFEGIDIMIEIRDELGRIDLNHAGAALLAGLFRAIGMPTPEADTIADRILDWRDPDDLRRLNGAEAGDYGLAGLPIRPRNARFQTVDELNLVLGMTPTIFRRVEAGLTVYSAKPTIDPGIAPRLARQALGADSMSSADYARSAGSPISRGNGTISPLLSLNGRAFLIHIDMTMKGTRVMREAVVRLTGDPSMPYWLLSWRQR